jgi:hypothetical protein
MERLSKFNGQGMQSMVQEFLERIIHKPVALDSGQAFKFVRSNSNAKVAVHARFTGASVPRMVSAFVQNL